MLSHGLEGQTTTASSEPQASRSSAAGSGRAVVGAVVADGAHRGLAAAPDEVFLELEHAVGRVDQRAHRVVAHRQQATAQREAAREARRHRGQGFTGGEAPRALDVHREVLVAEPEPGRAAEARDLVEEDTGIVFATPTLRLLDDAAERVHDRVEVRADAQAEMVEIVAGVDEDREVAGRQYAIEPERELRAAHAAADRQHSRRTAHWKRSSASGLIRAWPSPSAAIQCSPRTRTAGVLSAASPIAMPAAAATASASATWVVSSVRP